MERSKFLEGASKASGFISKYSTEILTSKSMRGLVNTTAMLCTERALSDRRRKALMESLLAVDDNFEKYKRMWTPNNQLRREKKPMRRTINYRRLESSARRNKKKLDQYNVIFTNWTGPITKEDI